MREDTRTAGYFHSINPGAAFPGVAEQLRSLSAVVVVSPVPKLFWLAALSVTCNLREGKPLFGATAHANHWAELFEISRRRTWPFHIHNPERTSTGTKTNRVGVA